MVAYDLDEESIRQLSATGFARHPELTGRFVGLAVKPDDPLADVGRTIERQVFEASFGNDAATMTAEYGRYEDCSIFFVVLDRRTGMPAGAARALDGGGKTLDDAPACIGRDLSEIVAAHGLHEGKIWEFATLAVLPEYRGRSSLIVSTLLYRTYINAGRRAEVRHSLAMLDHRAYRSTVLLGVPFRPLADSEPFEYLGSPSTRALYVAFDEIEPAIVQQSRHLRQWGAEHRGEIRSGGLRRLVTRRLAAHVSGKVASGRGLDEHIELPGLNRRLVNGRRSGVDRRRAAVSTYTGVERRAPGNMDRRRADDRRTPRRATKRRAFRRG